jgi:hypothetical protein
MEYGELGWVEIEGFPFWPARRADVQEIDSELQKLGREELVLIYFFGSHDYAWIDPSKVMPWDDNWEKFTTGKKSRLFQQALEEAYEWQKESYKRVLTRRRAAVKSKEIPLPAALMAEKRKHEKAVMKMMKEQEREWKRLQKKRRSEDRSTETISSSSSDDDDKNDSASLSSKDETSSSKSGESHVASHTSEGKVQISKRTKSDSSPSAGKANSEEVPNSDIMSTTKTDSAPVESKPNPSLEHKKKLTSSGIRLPPRKRMTEELIAKSQQEAKVSSEPPQTPSQQSSGSSSTNSLRRSLRSQNTNAAALPPPNNSTPTPSTPTSTHSVPSMNNTSTTSMTSTPPKTESSNNNPNDKRNNDNGNNNNKSGEVDKDVNKNSVSSSATLNVNQRDVPPPNAPSVISQVTATSSLTASTTLSSASSMTSATSTTVAATAAIGTVSSDGSPSINFRDGGSVATDVQTKQPPPSQPCPSCGRKSYIYLCSQIASSAKEFKRDVPSEDADTSLGIFLHYYLENHIHNLHYGIKPYACIYPNCCETFYTNFELRQHVNDTHLKYLYSIPPKPKVIVTPAEQHPQLQSQSQFQSQQQQQQQDSNNCVISLHNEVPNQLSYERPSLTSLSVVASEVASEVAKSPTTAITEIKQPTAQVPSSATHEDAVAVLAANLLELATDISRSSSIPQYLQPVNSEMKTPVSGEGTQPMQHTVSSANATSTSEREKRGEVQHRVTSTPLNLSSNAVVESSPQLQRPPSQANATSPSPQPPTPSPQSTPSLSKAVTNELLAGDHLPCEYPGCDKAFYGPNARIDRRRHIESFHLGLKRRICMECGQTIYGSLESSDRKRKFSGVRRGRGRPRKYPRPNDYPSISQSASLILSSASFPLAATSSTPSEIMAPLGIGGVTAKRGRGRPRKYPRPEELNEGPCPPIYESSNVPSLSAASSAPGALPTGSLSSVPPSPSRRRGPGRPRKYPRSLNSLHGSHSGDMQDRNGTSSTSLVTKRRGPGRPRKYPKAEPSRRKNDGTGTEPSSSSDIGESEGSDSDISTSNSLLRKGPGRPRKASYGLLPSLTATSSTRKKPLVSYGQAAFLRRIASARAAEGQKIPFLDVLPTVPKRPRGRPRKDDDEFRPGASASHLSSGPTTPDDSRGDINDPDYESFSELDNEGTTNNNGYHFRRGGRRQHVGPGRPRKYRGNDDDYVPPSYLRQSLAKEYETIQKRAVTTNNLVNNTESGAISSILKATEEVSFTLETMSSFSQSSSLGSLSLRPSPSSAKLKMPTNEELGLLSSLLDLCEGEYRRNDTPPSSSHSTEPSAPPPSSSSSPPSVQATTVATSTLGTSVPILQGLVAIQRANTTENSPFSQINHTKESSTPLPPS